MSKTTKGASRKSGKVNKYGLLAVVIIAAVILDTAALVGMQPNGLSNRNVNVGQTQKVLWSSNGINSNTVSVNLIKKVSDNPATYALVRTISVSKINNGSATWVPAASDVGNGLSLEIGCTPSTQACAAIDNHTSDLAVVASPAYANTAAAYQAIEAQANR